MKENKTSASQLRANAKYDKTRDRIALRLSIEDGQILRNAAEKAGQSVNSYIIQAIKERILRDSD